MIVPFESAVKRFHSKDHAVTALTSPRHARETITRSALHHYQGRNFRHTGATMAAQAGATMRELMDRLGHSTPQAALIYQHAAADRQADLAVRLSAMAAGELR